MTNDNAAGSESPFERFQVGHLVEHISLGAGVVTGNDGQTVTVTYNEISQATQGFYNEAYFKIIPTAWFGSSLMTRASSWRAVPVDRFYNIKSNIFARRIATAAVTRVAANHNARSRAKIVGLRISRCTATLGRRVLFQEHISHQLALFIGDG